MSVEPDVGTVQSQRELLHCFAFTIEATADTSARREMFSLSLSLPSLSLSLSLSPAELN
jgi:hypothetical protein